jgi:hypothetical protein
MALTPTSIGALGILPVADLAQYYHHQQRQQQQQPRLVLELSRLVVPPLHHRISVSEETYNATM